MAAVTPASQPQPSDLSLPHFFGNLTDPRRKHRRLHLLQDIIVIALCAVIAGAQDWQEVATFGRKRRAWLQRFLQLPNGIPSHDTFERVFDRLLPQTFQACFRAWVQALQAGLPTIRHVAIDGKTLRGSGSAKLGQLHLVSAWASAQRLLLGQVAVDGKSNEITAIPELLALLDLHGAIVTIDAMGCQKAIAQKILDRGGQYLLTVKENQPQLLADVEQALVTAVETNFAGLDHDTYETHDRGHGREEHRTYIVVHHPAGLRQQAEWPQLTTIGACISRRTVQGKTTTEVRHFIGSRHASAKVYGRALRSHWGIENAFHWQLDVTWDEDRNRVSKRHAAENLALLRRLSLMLLQAHPAPTSIAKKRYEATLDPDFLEEILRADGMLEKR